VVALRIKTKGLDRSDNLNLGTQTPDFVGDTQTSVLLPNKINTKCEIKLTHQKKRSSLLTTTAEGQWT
jgi:hypothetical protein